MASFLEFGQNPVPLVDISYSSGLSSSSETYSYTNTTGKTLFTYCSAARSIRSASISLAGGGSVPIGLQSTSSDRDAQNFVTFLLFPNQTINVSAGFVSGGGNTALGVEIIGFELA